MTPKSEAHGLTELAPGAGPLPGPNQLSYQHSVGLGRGSGSLCPGPPTWAPARQSYLSSTGGGTRREKQALDGNLQTPVPSWQGF